MCIIIAFLLSGSIFNFYSSFKVIQRLSNDNEELATEIYTILNKVFTKGKEMDQMMQNFKVFIIETQQSEKQLRKFEGKYNLSTLVLQQSS